MRKIAFTSITNNYLPKARALAHSIKRHAQDVTFVLLLAEDVNESLLRSDDPFDSFLTVSDLGISPLEPWLFCHTVVEVCTAIKGPAMLKLLSSNEDCAVLYFDPDMIVTSSLDPLFASFDHDAASILLTPHVTEPATTLDEILDNEISPLRYGVFNLGFLGVRNSSAGLKFADWWAKRLYDFCYDDIDNGIFTDQRWVDLAPAMFEGVSILRYPGYNVATWNLAHRVVTGSIEGGLTVNGNPLIFYHFSGFDSGAQELMLDKYGRQSPVLKDFREWYINECRRLGQDQIGSLPWTYSKFDNHQPITTAQRKLYRNREDLQRAFPNPFSTAKLNESYFQWYLHNNEQPTPVLTSESTCRILVLALEGGPDQVEALRKLVAKTARRSAIEVVATKAIREKLVQALPSLRFLDISYLDAATEEREFWILNKIIESQEDGLIFIQLGLQVPDFWDLRLQWAAGHEPTVLTVSPLYDGQPMTSPVEPGEASLLAPPIDIDRVVINSGHRLPIDAPTFLNECFFINETIARSLAESFRISCTTNQQRPRLAEFARYCRAKGFSHVIANNVYVGTNQIIGHIDLIKWAPDADIENYVRRMPLSEIRTHLRDNLSNDIPHTPSIGQQAARRHLHVMHSWGGGLEQWVRSFCRSDTQHVNMVLKSVWNMSGFSTGLALYASIDDPAPIAQWSLPIPIKATVPSNLSYQRFIRSIVRDYGIDVVLVSTLIGHSMDVLKTDAATILICHDHFPLTPEIYIRSCDLSGNRITEFSVAKVYERGAPTVWFPNYSRSEAQLAQKAFREILASGIIKLVTPSPSARRICLDLAPELNPSDITVIPNGVAPNILAATLVPYQSSGKLRIVILGRMCPEKGRALLETVILKLTEIGDVLLLGGAHQGLSFADIPGVRAIEEYEHDRLPELLNEFNPHLGLLLSNVPETFSYTLGELLALGVPPVAVRIGSLADRITEGVNGFLIDNSPEALIDTLMALDKDRTRLESVRKTLESGKHRTELEMVQDYELLLGMPRYSQRAFNGLQLPGSAYLRIPIPAAPELQSLSVETNGAAIALDPNPVSVSDGSALGIATVSFTFPEGKLVEIRVGSPNGQLFGRPAHNGATTTGKWVSDGMIFFLQDVTNGNELTYEHTLATAAARVVAVPRHQDEITSPINNRGRFLSSLVSLFSRNSSLNGEQKHKVFFGAHEEL